MSWRLEEESKLSIPQPSFKLEAYFKKSWEYEKIWFLTHSGEKPLLWDGFKEEEEEEEEMVTKLELI